ncbi:LysR family transcriptional regulator [Undibacterium sp. TJN19]|uniref:LysR family transcriptional regulator n=1 Tax=Undibacterium sp. TJN19 TaxID=3413055 RepID=UPI003BF3B3E8
MKNNHEPTLDDLSVFVAVCKANGFRAAAKQLGLSPSHVSEIITRIEKQLGLPLLIRNTRSVMPTEVGRLLENRLSPLFAEAHSSIRDLGGPGIQVQGLLKLNVTGAVMVDILPPLIDRFLVMHPAVKIEIIVDDRLVDAIAEGCDAGIRYGENLAQDMIAIPIGPQWQQLALAAAPFYLDGRDCPNHPLEVLQHECVRLRFTSGALTAWDFERDGEKIRVDPPSRLILGVDAAAAAIGLACDGHGLICTFKNWLDPFFESGQLVPVMPDWWQRFEGPRLYFTSRRMPGPLRAFVNMITETA